MPPRRTTAAGYSHGRRLRKKMTLHERTLWAHLRRGQLLGVTFRRQHAIGPYVADFCAPRHRLIIELDGNQHLDQQEQDNDRTAFLRAQGYRVIRFWNDQIMKDMQGVARAILDALGEQ